MYTNRTNKCVSQVVVELRLSHEGIVSDERHSIVFQPLLGPGQSQSVDVKLKIVTSDRGEDVALLGWHTIKASGFASGAGAPTYDENRFQIVKDPEDPFAAYGGHQTKPPNPTNLGQTSPKATITADAARGRLLQKSVPVYPPIAQAARVSGTVVLQATISKTGAVEELKVVSGPPMLQQAALDAVKTWRYKPYLVNKKAVPVQAQVIVVFSLGG
jgi:TonB family protein